MLRALPLSRRTQSQARRAHGRTRRARPASTPSRAVQPCRRAVAGQRLAPAQLTLVAGRDEEGRAVLVLLAGKQVHDEPQAATIETRHRFVRHHQARPGDQGARDRHALALAGVEPGGIVAGLGCQAQLRPAGRRPVHGRRRRPPSAEATAQHAAAAGRFRAQSGRESDWGTGRRSRSFRRAGRRGLVRTGAPPAGWQRRHCLRWRCRACRRSAAGGLAAAPGAAHGHHFPAAYLQVNIVQRMHAGQPAAIHLVHARQADHIAGLALAWASRLP